jgi:hypothetical protein
MLTFKVKAPDGHEELSVYGPNRSVPLEGRDKQAADRQGQPQRSGTDASGSFFV